MKLRLAALAMISASALLAWCSFTLYTAPISIGDIAPTPQWVPDVAASDLSAPTSPAPPDPELLSRLAFSPTRRPPGPRPPAVEEAEKAAEEAEAQPSKQVVDVPPPEGAILQGIFMDEARREALVVVASHPAGLWLKPGDELDGWRVSRIAADRITLTSGDREIALTLYTEKLAE